MDSMPLLDDFNFNEINLDFLESPPRSKSKTTATNLGDLAIMQMNAQIETEAQATNYKASSTELKDFNLDFLNSPEKQKPKVNYLAKYAKQSPLHAGINIKKEETTFAGSSSKTLAKRIAEVDGLVRQLHDVKAENKHLKNQLEDFNNNAKEIRLLYNQERNARIEAEAKNQKLEAELDQLDTELAGKTLELDQVQAQMDECSGPIIYSELAMRYLKLAQKLDEERLLHWHDQPLYKDIEKYCKEKGFKISKIMPRSPPKRKTSVNTMVRKSEAQVQCDLWQGTVEKPSQRDQASQCVQIETRNQGCQHIGTTTTRSTTTDCFFKYHDVGTNCTPVDFEPTFNAILEEMRNFSVDFESPLSPIIDTLEESVEIEPIMSNSLPSLSFNSNISPNPSLTVKEFCTIGVNTDVPIEKARKSVGSCTYICNVQRPIDFVMVQPIPMQPTPISIKLSNSRPPSTTAGLAYENIKDEINSRSSNSSPLNFNMYQMGQSSSAATILPNAFDELWQIFGHMLYSLLNRRLPNLSVSNGNIGNTNHVSNQQDFYNWLHTLYNNVQQSTQNNTQQNPPTLDSVTNLGSAEMADLTATPLNFSDAIPSSETMPNTIRPTALRSHAKEPNTARDTESPSVVTRKSIATSPIRYICTTPTTNNNRNSDNHNRLELENEASCRRGSAFKGFKSKSKSPNLVLDDVGVEQALNEDKAGYKSVYKDIKRLKRLRRKHKNPNEFREAQNFANSNKKTELINDKKSKEQQKLNNELFGSVSTDETDTEMQIIESLETLSDTTSSNETTLSENESDTRSLRSSLNSRNRNSSCSSVESCLSNKTIEMNKVDKLVNSPKEAATEISSNFNSCNNEANLSQLKSITHENYSNSVEDFVGNQTTPRNRGRKRKINCSNTTTATTTIRTTTPCKRSARLLAKQENQQLNTCLATATKKTLPLLTLEHGQVVTKKSSKSTQENSCGENSLAKKCYSLRSRQALSNSPQTPPLASESLDTSSIWQTIFSPINDVKKTTETKEILSKNNLKMNGNTAENNLNIYTKQSTDHKIPIKRPALVTNSESTLTSNVENHATTTTTTSSILNFYTAQHKPTSHNMPTNLSSNSKQSSTVTSITNNKQNVETDLEPVELKTREQPKLNIFPTFSTQTTHPTTSTKINLNAQTTTTVRPANTLKMPGESQSIFNLNLASESAKIQTTVPMFSLNCNNSAAKINNENTNVRTEIVPSPQDGPRDKSGHQLPITAMFRNNSGQTLLSNDNVVTTSSVTTPTIDHSFKNVTANQHDSLLINTKEETNFTPPQLTDLVAAGIRSVDKQKKSIDSIVDDYSCSLHNSNITSSNVMKFDTPPASPPPTADNEIEEHSVKEIPHELTLSAFPTWRRWRQHQRSLLHQLISVYDAKSYQGFHNNNVHEITKPIEKEKLQQILTLINDYLKQSQQMPTTISGDIFNFLTKLQAVTNESKLIAQAILLSMQKQQRPMKTNYKPYEQNCDTTTSIDAMSTYHDPFTQQNVLTQAQLCCSYILNVVSTETLQMLLQQIESLLFDVKNADGLTLYEALNLTDLYLMTLQHQYRRQSTSESIFNKNPARLFIAKCLYYHKLKAPPMIYLVLSVYPTVLPHREERDYDHSDPLITVIKHCLMCHQYDTNNSELMQRELLSKLRFEYHFECFKPDFHEVLNNLLEKLRAGKLEQLKFAWAIFCKCLPAEKVANLVLQQHFIPLANEFYRQVSAAQNEQAQNYAVRTAALLDCFSTVIKPFPRGADGFVEISNYLHIFKQFLDVKSCPLVQEAAIHAILRLQRFDFLACYRALSHFRLSGYELQPHTKAALRTFIYRKPWSFWRALLTQQNA